LAQAEQSLSKLPGVTGKAISIAADLSKFSEIQRVAKEVERNEGLRGLDILIANSGTSWGAPFDSQPDEASAKVLDLNVRGVFHLIQQYG
jgi:NAD(P)-dependent dehydrogenase (short-subunit alcohol dehydrogenase family)